MTEIIKFAAAGIICAILAATVKTHRPEFFPVVEVTGIIVIVLMIIKHFRGILDDLAELSSAVDIIGEGYIKLLIKVLMIAVITNTGSDICNDSGNSAIASNIELAGKVMILILCFSIIKTIAALAGGLLG